MHIVYITTELATQRNSSGGLASYVANMSRIFAEHGHDVTILLVTSKPQEMEFDKNIELINIYIEKGIWDSIAEIAKISVAEENERDYRAVLLNIYKSRIVNEEVKKIHQKKKIDIIHATNLGSITYQLDGKIPYVVRLSSFEGMCEAANKRIYNVACGLNKLSMKNRLNLEVVKKSPYVISPSKFLASIAKEEYDFEPEVLESPFSLVKNNWNNDLYEELLKGKRYILHFGSLKYLKGTHIVAEIAKDLLEKHSDMYLVLAGNSEYMELENGEIIQAHEFVKKKAGSCLPRVMYIGRPVRESLYPIISNAELCLLPSRIENLSNACIEAMAMGKIVIATNGASYEQLIVDKINGYLCERDNSKSFLDSVNEALELSNEEKTVMSDRAREAVERLNPNRVYDNYLNYYQKVIKEWRTEE